MTKPHSKPTPDEINEKRRLEEALEEGLEETFRAPIPLTSPSRREREDGHVKRRASSGSALSGSPAGI